MATLEEIAGGLDFEPETTEEAEAMTAQQPAAPQTLPEAAEGSVSGTIGRGVVRRLRNTAADMWNNVQAAGQLTNPDPAGRLPLGEVGVNDAGQTTIGSTDHMFDPKKHVMLRDRTTGKTFAYNRTPGTDEDRVSAFARLLSSNIADAPPAWMVKGLSPAQAQSTTTLGTKSPEMRQVFRDPRGKFSRGPQVPEMTAQSNANLGLGAGTLGYQMMKNREGSGTER